MTANCHPEEERRRIPCREAKSTDLSQAQDDSHFGWDPRLAGRCTNALSRRPPAPGPPFERLLSLSWRVTRAQTAAVAAPPFINAPCPDTRRRARQRKKSPFWRCLAKERSGRHVPRIHV